MLPQDHPQEKPLWRGVVSGFLDALYPPTCLACREPVDTSSGLCARCWRDTHFLAGPVCDRCGAPMPLDLSEADNAICDACTHAPPAWHKGRCAVAYDGAGRRAILQLKHGDRPEIAKPLARWVTGAAASITDDIDFVVPVPLHRLRLFKRKYNQAGELAHQVAKRLSVPCLPRALIRVHATKPQSGTRAERFETVKNAFAVAPDHVDRLRGHNILIIDDVITTGATVSACAHSLEMIGVKCVNAAAVARVLRPE